MYKSKKSKITILQQVFMLEALIKHGVSSVIKNNSKKRMGDCKNMDDLTLMLLEDIEKANKIEKTISVKGFKTPITIKPVTVKEFKDINKKAKTKYEMEVRGEKMKSNLMPDPEMVNILTVKEAWISPDIHNSQFLQKAGLFTDASDFIASLPFGVFMEILNEVRELSNLEGIEDVKVEVVDEVKNV